VFLIIPGLVIDTSSTKEFIFNAFTSIDKEYKKFIAGWFPPILE
jgi:hypothetical protein